ncbi:PD-(D/E)XK nuclease family protein [Haliea sp. E1-2-M8]|uniref:PD-(D/E)XK nuclease family protein n=1 Tax=Haliea sp. E1-2-M8 TaxID=3064706 RepID=UPI00272355FF|nr:PD-(D/E)XK nuclease family protein [Haliea sp. E1-2-M8]MDO8863331.1 PD-(D/E)XK nuclease family protein [Haliea sp. E1-2-M8]
MAAAAPGPLVITLSLAGDGPQPVPTAPALGRASLGPGAMLRALETRLGIPATDTPFSTRLIQYLACVDQCDHPAAFYHASWQADPFAVARSLLQWRDQWYLAGWSGSFASAGPGRLADMAAIEEVAASAVEPGLGQRLQRVLELLPTHNPAIAAVHLLDPLGDFPPLWQRLLRALPTDLTEAAEPGAQGAAGSDLRRVQERLLAAGSERAKVRLTGDGSLRVLTADSPRGSAPLVARLVRQQLAANPGATLAVLAEQRGDQLDEALEASGGARLGFGSASPWRPVFQLLPLACELLWQPLNPTALFQFLSHPVGPLPQPVRRTLARTVAAVPGIGSPAWESAVADCLAAAEDGQILEEAIAFWLQPERFAPDSGVPGAQLAARARRVAEWLLRAREASTDPAQHTLYNTAINQAQELVKAIERLAAAGRDRLTRDNVLRLIEDVRGSGSAVTDRCAQTAPGAGNALATGQAGSFTAPVDRVLWWDCQASDRVQRWPWSRRECAALEAAGVNLHSEAARLDWLGRAWQRPLLSARAQCTLVLHSDAAQHHPVWDLLSSICDGLPVLAAADPGSAALLQLPHSPLPARTLPPLARWWQLPAGTAIPAREAESYSSLDAWIHSPYQWLLRYGARIQPGSLASVSDGSTLKGNLAHRLLELYFRAHPEVQTIRGNDIAAWVDTHCYPLLEQEGALLLEAGRQAECERFITVLQEGLVALVAHLQEAGVVAVQMEQELQGSFTGGKLTGSIDLLALTGDGREAVVDIKWGGRKYRRQSLLDGSFLQLAVYAQLRRAAGASHSPCLSYFIVSDAHMLSLNHTFFPGAENVTPSADTSPADYWHRFEHTWHWRRAQFDRGLVEVTVAGTEPDAGSSPGEDGLPIPDTSDSFSDYRALTGWDDNA